LNRAFVSILVIYLLTSRSQKVQTFSSNSTKITQYTYEDQLESRNILLRTKCGESIQTSRSKCNNHGICGVNPFGTYGPNFLSESDSFVCKCDTGYYGRLCELGPACLPGFTCANGGSCIAILTDAGIYQKCLCPVGNGKELIKDKC